MAEVTWYPVNLDLRGRRCVVVGAGTVAEGKIRELRDCGASVTVVAPHVSPGVEALASSGSVVIERRPYMSADLDDTWYVVAATDDPASNAAVKADGDARRIFVNAADDPDNCSAILPARVRRGDLLVAFSTSGSSPAFAKWLRTQGEAHYGPEYGELIDLAAAVRRQRRANGQPTNPSGWQKAFDSGILELVRQGRTADAKELLDACLSSSSG